jgi:hypothetical protein
MCLSTSQNGLLAGCPFFGCSLENKGGRARVGHPFGDLCASPPKLDDARPFSRNATACTSLGCQSEVNRLNEFAESQRDGMREPPNRDLQPTAWIGSLLPGFPPLKPRGLRFSRRAAIGCCHGRQPMEWSVLIALKPQPGDTSRPASNSCRHMFEMAIRIVVIADWRHACRCFATPTSPLNRSSDWRPRLLHGIASQFNRDRAIFRLGMEVATLRSRDDADTPSTSTLRPPISRSFA